MEERLLTIGEFSRLSGIKRKTLIFYDREGVFSPSEIGRNGYRRYSPRQLQVANVIVSLREINVPLDEIKAFLSIRTPGRLVELCRRQEKRIVSELEKLGKVRDVIRSLQAATESAGDAVPGGVAELTLPPARLFMGPEIGSADMRDINAALSDFFGLCVEKGVPQTHPLGSTTNIAGGRGVFRPTRFYRPAGDAVPAALTTIRPGGRYAVGYARGDYGMLDGLYKKMLAYAKRKRLRIVGDAYEEYVLSETAVSNPDLYLARVAFMIA